MGEVPVATVDRRSRVDGADVDFDPAEFLSHQLPEVLLENGHLLDQALWNRPLRPLTISVGGDEWTLRSEDGRAFVEHAGGPALLRLDPEQLADLVADQTTPISWLSSGTLRLENTRLEHVLWWWLILRGALDGVHPHVEGDVDLSGRDGTPLDLGRSFRPDDPRDEMASFLATAGFLHITELFTSEEMAEVAADMDRAAPRYSRGDGRSWWAELADGSDALVRMHGFDTESPVTAQLVLDDRLQSLAGLLDDGHEFGRRASNRIEALFKPLGVVKGISDVPWHKDCSLGRHSYDCSGLTVGISVTGSDAVSGQLSMVAGSHRALMWPAPVVQPGLDLPVVDLPTSAGDVTIHCSCTLHMANPPVERPRRVMYTSFTLPPADREAAAEGRRRLGAVRDLAPTTVSQLPSPAR